MTSRSRAPSTASGEVVRATIDAGRALGLDAGDLYRTLALDPAELAREDCRVPELVVLRLWEELEARTNDPHVGLRVAETLASSGQWGILEYAMRTCRDFDDAWDRIARLLPLAFRGSDEIVDVVDENGTRQVGYRRLPGGNPLVPASEDCVVTSFALALHGALAEPFHLVAAFFQRSAPPGGDAEHRRVLGCPVHFDALFNGLAVDRTTRRIPMKAHDPQLLVLIETLAEKRLAALAAETSFVESLGAWVERRLDAGAPYAIEDAARAFHSSVRSLQRTLAESDATYRGVVDDVRERVAMAHLHDTPPKDLAARLGFTGTTQLYRAVKRWTGLPLAECRQRIAIDP